MSGKKATYSFNGPSSEPLILLIHHDNKEENKDDDSPENAAKYFWELNRQIVKDMILHPSRVFAPKKADMASRFCIAIARMGKRYEFINDHQGEYHGFIKYRYEMNSQGELIVRDLSKSTDDQDYFISEGDYAKFINKFGKDSVRKGKNDNILHPISDKVIEKSFATVPYLTIADVKAVIADISATVRSIPDRYELGQTVVGIGSSVQAKRERKYYVELLELWKKELKDLMLFKRA